MEGIVAPVASLVSLAREAIYKAKATKKIKNLKKKEKKPKMGTGTLAWATKEPSCNFRNMKSSLGRWSI